MVPSKDNLFENLLVVPKPPSKVLASGGFFFTSEIALLPMLLVRDSRPVFFYLLSILTWAEMKFASVFKSSCKSLLFRSGDAVSESGYIVLSCVALA